jgi:hypothetical protein
VRRTITIWTDAARRRSDRGGTSMGDKGPGSKSKGKKPKATKKK